MELDQIKKDIAEFEEFKKSIDRQQLTFPLDSRSIGVMHEDLMIPTGNIIYPYIDGPITPGSLNSQEATVNGKRFLLAF